MTAVTTVRGAVLAGHREHRHDAQSAQPPGHEQDEDDDAARTGQDDERECPTGQPVVEVRVGVAKLDERRRTKSSPLVRKIASENNVDISQIQGSGVSGRVTKNDILGFLQQPAAEPARAPAPAQKQPQFAPGESVRIEPLSVMRKKIAQHMILSKQTSAHVTTAFEVDFTNVEKLRRQYKDSFAERGVKLTYLPFIVQAVIAGPVFVIVIDAPKPSLHWLVTV